MSEASRIVVPSDTWPTLAAAVADAEESAQIHIQQGHSEVLRSPLIIDKAVHIEGPEGGHCSIESEESVIAAPGKNGVVVLKRLELKVFGAPALIVAGGCHLEHCSIDGASTGVEVTAHAGSTVRIEASVVQNCKIGVSLSGGADCAMDGSQIQQCVIGCSVTGMLIKEGWNEKLGSVAKAKFTDNVDADLMLRGWSIQGKDSEGVRFSGPDGEVVVKGWPTEPQNVVAPTETGSVVLLFNGGRVNATLFEESDEEQESDGSDADFPKAESPSAAALTARAGAEGVEGSGDEASAGPRKTKRGSFLMEEIPPRASLVEPETDGPRDEAGSQQKTAEESGMPESAEEVKLEPAEKATEELGPTEPAEEVKLEPAEKATEEPGLTDPAEEVKLDPAEKATEELGLTKAAEEVKLEPAEKATEEPSLTEPAENVKLEPAEKATEEPGLMEPAEEVKPDPAEKATEEPSLTEPAEEVKPEPAEKATEEPGLTKTAEEVKPQPAEKATEEPGVTEPAEEVKLDPAEKATEEPGQTEPAEQAEAEPKQVAEEVPGPSEPAQQAEAEPKFQPEHGPAPAEPAEREFSPIDDDVAAAPVQPRAIV